MKGVSKGTNCQLQDTLGCDVQHDVQCLLSHVNNKVVKVNLRSSIHHRQKMFSISFICN